MIRAKEAEADALNQATQREQALKDKEVALANATASAEDARRKEMLATAAQQEAQKSANKAATEAAT